MGNRSPGQREYRAVCGAGASGKFIGPAPGMPPIIAPRADGLGQSESPESNVVADIKPWPWTFRREAVCMKLILTAGGGLRNHYAGLSLRQPRCTDPPLFSVSNLVWRGKTGC